MIRLPYSPCLKTYPIPDIAHSKNSAVVKRIVENARSLVETSAEEERSALENENDRLIYLLFGLTDEEIQELEFSLAFKSVSP